MVRIALAYPSNYVSATTTTFTMPLIKELLLMEVNRGSELNECGVQYKSTRIGKPNHLAKQPERALATTSANNTCVEQVKVLLRNQ
eukprot:scaffold3515_cov126-Cylindrotheca_fusiformis.AAC.32